MPFPSQLVILGSTSFLGRSIPKQLLQNYEEALRYGSADCDLASEQSTLSAAQNWKPGCHILFFSVVNKPVDNSRAAYEKNLAFARNLAKAARKAQAGAVLFTSSVDVYGHAPALPVTENSPTNPDSWYAKAKLASETLLQKELPPRCPLGIFRCSGMYDLSENDISVVGRFYKTAQAGGTITLHNKGRNLRDFALADDLHTLFEHWLESPRAGLWNAVSGTSIPIATLAETITSQTGLGSVRKLGEDQRNFDIAFDADSITQSFGPNPIRPVTTRLPIQISKQQHQETDSPINNA